MLILALSSSLAVAAPPSSEALRAAWSAQQPAVSTNSNMRILLEDRDFDVIAKGGVAKHRIAVDGADLAMGASWLDVPIDQVWLAIQDSRHKPLSPNAKIFWLAGTTAEKRYIYGWLDLPAPFRDRQWVTAVTNNGALYEATDGATWERTWVVDDQTRTPQSDPNAMWMEINDGGWMLIPVDGGTLTVFSARAVVGGMIPDELATRWAMGRLDETMAKVGEIAVEMPEHYRGEHQVVLRPNRVGVPRFDETARAP